MKTPWRFLIDLTSRGKSPDPGEQPLPPSDAANPDEAESEAEPAAPSADLVERGDEAGKTDVSPVRSVVPGEPKAEPDQPKIPSDVGRRNTGANAASPATKKRTTSAPTASAKVSKRTKPMRALATPKNAIDASDKKSTKTVPLPPPSFFDEVASLDDEIEQLRTALVQKLNVQNAQLKKMLERFEVS